MTDARDKTADLQALSEAATQGEWHAATPSAYNELPRISAASDCTLIAECGNATNENDVFDANSEFACALVNAYRSGDLVPAKAVEDAGIRGRGRGHLSALVWMEARCDGQPEEVGCWKGDEGQYHSDVREYLKELKAAGWKITNNDTICPHCANIHECEP